MTNIVVFGAGIAGLSTAHYLIDRGYNVTVVESLDVPGGLARSERIANDKGIPSEYSWRGFGPWYHNAFEIMKDIPVKYENVKSNVYNQELSRINFILTSDSDDSHKKAKFDNAIRMTLIDKIKLAWMSLYAWTSSNERSNDVYASMNALEWLKSNLSDVGAETLGSVFGPWVGVDASRASIHHVTGFFSKNVFPGPPAPYYYPAIPSQNGEKERPAFVQGSCDSWLLLRRPSNEAWFDPWVRYLKERGVKFIFSHALNKLNYDPKNHLITSAEIIATNNKPVISQRIIGDRYVLAINPFATNSLLKKSPDLLASDSQLKLFEKLTEAGPHIQISFRIAFSEKIKLSGIESDIETAVILVDSEFDITLFSQDHLFRKDVYLGPNVKSLWSGTATIDSIPGKLYNLPMRKLTKQQFINEIKHQIYRSHGLNKLVMDANNNRPLNSFKIIHIEVWHTWIFPENNEGSITALDVDKKWVNNTYNNKYQPEAKTSIDNLYLAGAHTKTETDLYSMEAAAESGRRVADIISGKQTVLSHKSPIGLRPIHLIDSIFYKYGLPHILDVVMTIILLTILIFMFK